MLLDLVTIEHASDPTVLTNEAQQVQFPLSHQNLKLIEDMKDTLYQIKGVGLAAPQVGHRVKIILVHITDDASKMREDGDGSLPMTVFVNPSYEPVSLLGMREDWEGCFSVEKTMGKVPRYVSIRFRAQDVHGTWHESVINGFYARVLQHEIDHVNGTLIIHRLKDNHLQGPPEEMRAVRQKEMESAKPNNQSKT